MAVERDYVAELMHKYENAPNHNHYAPNPWLVIAALLQLFQLVEEARSDIANLWRDVHERD